MRARWLLASLLLLATPSRADSPIRGAVAVSPSELDSAIPENGRVFVELTEPSQAPRFAPTDPEGRPWAVEARGRLLIATPPSSPARFHLQGNSPFRDAQRSVTSSLPVDDVPPPAPTGTLVLGFGGEAMNLVQRPGPDDAAILVLSEDGQLYDAFVAAEGANRILPGAVGACFWLVAIDQAGNESERAGPVCPVKPADFEEGGCRCAHSPASSLGTILFGLLGLSMCARARRV